MMIFSDRFPLLLPSLALWPPSAGRHRRLLPPVVGVVVGRHRWLLPPVVANGRRFQAGRCLLAGFCFLAIRTAPSMFLVRVWLSSIGLTFLGPPADMLMHEPTPPPLLAQP